ncbi:unnamed protein product, partial [Ectocarpus fasciculatus]
GDTYVDYFDGEFDLSEFTWVFDLVGAYTGVLPYDDDVVEIYEYYAMWSPEEKDNPEDVESWFAMRRDEGGEVFVEDVSNLVSFNCGCSGDDMSVDEDDQDGSLGGLASGSTIGTNVFGVWG